MHGGSTSKKSRASKTYCGWKKMQDRTITIKYIPVHSRKRPSSQKARRGRMHGERERRQCSWRESQVTWRAHRIWNPAVFDVCLPGLSVEKNLHYEQTESFPKGRGIWGFLQWKVLQALEWSWLMILPCKFCQDPHSRTYTNYETHHLGFLFSHSVSPLLDLLWPYIAIASAYHLSVGLCFSV